MNIDVAMSHLSYIRRDYAYLMFELTLTLTLSPTVRVRVSSNIKPAKSRLHVAYHDKAFQRP